MAQGRWTTGSVVAVAVAAMVIGAGLGRVGIEPAARAAMDGGREVHASAAGIWALPAAVVELREDGTGDVRLDDRVVRASWTQEEDRVRIEVEDPKGDVPAVLSGSVCDGYVTLQGTGALYALPVLLPFGSYPIEATDSAQVEEAISHGLRSQCLSNLRQLHTALLTYAEDFGGYLPSAAVDWREVTEPYIRSLEVFECLADDELPSYFLNPAIAGMHVDKVAAPWDTILVYESDDGEHTAYRHQDGACFAFADGHAKWFARAPKTELWGGPMWDPRHPPYEEPLSAEELSQRKADDVRAINEASWLYTNDTGVKPRTVRGLLSAMDVPGFQGPYMASEPLDPFSATPYELRDGEVVGPGDVVSFGR